MFVKDSDDETSFEACLKVLIPSHAIFHKFLANGSIRFCFNIELYLLDTEYTPTQCAKSVMQSKIISNEKDLLGVVFYATVSHYYYYYYYY